MKAQVVMAIAAVALLMTAGTASATKSRINSMGGGIKELTVLDDRNIFQLPAELVKWGTWAGIEIHDDFTSFGFHYNFNPTTVLAAYGTSTTRAPMTIPGVDQSGGGPMTTTGDVGSTHKGTILFGVDLGSTRIGALLAIWGDRAATFDDGGAIASNEGILVIDFIFGLGFAAGSSDIDIALEFAYGAPTHEDNLGEKSSNYQVDIGLVGRGSIPFSGPHEIVPYLDLDIAVAAGQELEDGKSAFGGLDFNLALGVDIRLNLPGDITIQPGLGLSFGTTSLTETPADGSQPILFTQKGEFVIPFYNLAVDVKVVDWFNIRFGGGQRIVFKTTDSLEGAANACNLSGGCPSESDVEHNVAAGMAFKMPAGVTLDLDVNLAWWQNGAFFLSGNTTNFGVSAALSKDW